MFSFIKCKILLTDYKFYVISKNEYQGKNLRVGITGRNKNISDEEFNPEAEPRVAEFLASITYM